MTVDYQPIANGGGANTVSQSDFLALLAGELVNGFQAGVANSAKVNKVVRQSSVMSAALATFISSALGVDVLDDGDVAALAAKMLATVQAVSAQHGQCILTKSGANLLLSPRNGNKLYINGAQHAIPDAGITLAVGATLTEGGTPAASTLYYVYAYMNGATMTLQASATGHAVQAGTGVEIRSGDATRTLVGMARTNASPAWVDADAQRFVASWFQRGRRNVLNTFAADRSTVSATFEELSSSERVEFLCWLGETVHLQTSGSMLNTAGGGAFADVSIGFDNATAQETFGRVGSGTAAITGPASCSVSFSNEAEGYHYATVLGKSSNGSTCTWAGSGSPGTRSSISGAIG